MPVFGIRYCRYEQATATPPLPYDEWYIYDEAYGSGTFSTFIGAKNEAKRLEDESNPGRYYNHATQSYVIEDNFLPRYKYMAFKLPEEQDYVARETRKIEAGELTLLPEHMQPDFGSCYAFPRLIENEDGTKQIGYYESEHDARYDRLTKVKPTRYFAAFFNEDQMWDYMAELGLVSANMTIGFARTREDIRYIYENGPESCMTGSADQYAGDGCPHPVEAYASPDLELAYLYSGDVDPLVDKTANTTIISRALCNRNTKEYVRIYGDIKRMEKMLEEMGYDENIYCLGGCRLLKLYGVRNGREDRNIIMTPFLDGNNTEMEFHPKEDFLTIIAKPIIIGGSTQGYARLRRRNYE
jgi:hypothetical protein